MLGTPGKGSRLHPPGLARSRAGQGRKGAAEVKEMSVSCPGQPHTTALSLSGPRKCCSEITPDAATITSPLCPRLFSGLPEHKRPISKGMSPPLAGPGMPSCPRDGRGCGCCSSPGWGAAGSPGLGTALGAHGRRPDMELSGHIPQFPGRSHCRVQEMKGCQG